MPAPDTAATATDPATAAAGAAPSLPGLAADRVAALLSWAVETRSSVHLIGDHGIGKTAYVRAWCQARGLRVVERSLPVCSQRDFCVPLPVQDPATGRRHLEVLVLEQLLQADAHDRYVLILDEFSRADRATLNTAMELLQEATIAGQELPGLAAVVALDNPTDDEDYAGVAGLDLAQADRVATLHVDVDDIPWRSHLTEVHGRPLDGVWQVWGRLAGDARKVLCPRVLDHLLTVVDAHLPAELALPVLPSGRQRLYDTDGNDRTDETLRELTATIRASWSEAAHPASPPGASPAGGGGTEATRAIAAAITSGWQLRLVGAPGIGKTSYIRQVVEEAGYELEYVSLSQTSITDLVVPVPVAGRLEFLPAARLVRPERRYVLVLDEFSRASADTASAAMELVNERSIAGRQLDGCVAVLALDNPAEVAGLHLDTGRIDVAQASRFTATLNLGEDDLPWREVLRARFPAHARTFLDWRAEDLDDAARVLVSPRCVERMLSLHAAGLDVDLALPMLGGQRVPVGTVALRRRLRGEHSRGLAALAADLDQVLDRLTGGDDRTELAVLAALQRAEPATLATHEAAVTRLLGAIHPNHRLALVRGGEPRREVLLRALRTVATSPAVDTAAADGTEKGVAC